MEGNLQLAAVGVDHVEQFVVGEDYVGEDDASDDDLTRDFGLLDQEAKDQFIGLESSLHEL